MKEVVESYFLDRSVVTQLEEASYMVKRAISANRKKNKTKKSHECERFFQNTKIQKNISDTWYLFGQFFEGCNAASTKPGYVEVCKIYFCPFCGKKLE